MKSSSKQPHPTRRVVLECTGPQSFCFRSFVVALMLLLSYDAAADDSDGEVDEGNGINRLNAQLLQELITATTEGGEEWEDYCTGIYPLSIADVHTYGVCIDSTGNITHLLLRNCNLRGTIPDSIGDMAALVAVDFTINRLHGTVPASMSKLQRLTRLAFSLNSLSGTLPPSYSLLVNLEFLSIQNNQLNGTLPQAMFTGMTKLVSFMLAQNAFSGPLPHLPCSSAGGGALRSFYLNNNQFTGELPSTWNVCYGLETIGLSYNKITGTLPDAWSSFANLSVVVLNNNDLSGTLPDSWGSLSKLTGIFLSSNPRLTGTIPASWVTPEKAKVVWFAIGLCGTRLTGSLPPSWNISAFQFNLECNRTFVPFVPSSTRTVSTPQVVSRSVSTMMSVTLSFSMESGTAGRVGEDNLVPRRIALVNVVGTTVAVGLSSLALMSSAAFGSKRTSLITQMGLIGCAKDREYDTSEVLAASVGAVEAPLQLAFGVSEGAHHRGAIAGNITLLAVLFVAVVLAVVCVQYLCRPGGCASIASVLAAGRLPGVLFSVVPLLLQQVVVSLSVLLSVTPSLLDAAICGFGAAAVAGLTALSLGVAREIERRGVCAAVDRPWPSWNHCVGRYGAHEAVLRYATAAKYAWASSPEKRNDTRQDNNSWSLFVGKYGIMFEGYRWAMRGWLVIELLVTLLLATFSGVVPESHRMCEGLRWSAAAVALGYTSALAVCKPMNTRLDASVVAVVSCAQCAVALLSALDVAPATVSGIASALSWIEVAMVVLGVAVLVWGRRCKERSGTVRAAMKGISSAPMPRFSAAGALSTTSETRGCAPARSASTASGSVSLRSGVRSRQQELLLQKASAGQRRTTCASTQLVLAQLVKAVCASRVHNVVRTENTPL